MRLFGGRPRALCRIAAAPSVRYLFKRRKTWRRDLRVQHILDCTSFAQIQLCMCHCPFSLLFSKIGDLSQPSLECALLQPTLSDKNYYDKLCNTSQGNVGRSVTAVYPSSHRQTAIRRTAFCTVLYLAAAALEHENPRQKLPCLFPSSATFLIENMEARTGCPAAPVQLKAPELAIAQVCPLRADLRREEING